MRRSGRLRFGRATTSADKSRFVLPTRVDGFPNDFKPPTATVDRGRKQKRNLINEKKKKRTNRPSNGTGDETRVVPVGGLLTVFADALRRLVVVATRATGSD